MMRPDRVPAGLGMGVIKFGGRMLLCSGEKLVGCALLLSVAIRAKQAWCKNDK